MTTEEKSRLHIALLQALRSLGDLGMTEQQLLNHATVSGFDLSLPQLQVELRGLSNLNYIAPFSPLGGKRYMITDIGASKLAQAGL